MTDLRLGFFPQFKDGDAVLLSGTVQGVTRLCVQLSQFVASHSAELPVHNLANVSLKHPAQLFASRTPQRRGSGFCWLCSSEQLGSIRSKLEALAKSGSGHQSFPLERSSAELLVSIGEYGKAWWESHG